MYKGQVRHRRKLMTCTYWEFLFHGELLQAPIPTTSRVQRFTRSLRKGKYTELFSVECARPRTSKSITDPLLFNLVRVLSHPVPLRRIVCSKEKQTESGSSSELSKQITPPSRNADYHAPPTSQSRKSYQSFSVLAW